MGNYVLADDQNLRFNTALPYWRDTEQFERAAADRPEAGSPGALGTTPTDPTSLAAAADLYQGPYLDGYYSDWILLEQERLRGLYLELLGRLLDRFKQAGDYAQALTYARQLVLAEPLHEAALRELMRLYHLLGRDTEAIVQYQRCRKVLQDDLGVEPAPETEALYQALVHRVPLDLDVSAAHLPAPAHRPIYNLDNLPLVGHKAEREALLGHLEAIASGQGGIVLLEGEPGIGKTRLAQEIIAGARWRNIGTTIASAAEIGVSASYALLLAALKPQLTPLRVRQLAHLVEAVHLQVTAPLVPQIAQALPDQPPPPPLPPTEARERLQQALAALILGLARIAPHLWVLEDIHWADGETLALLPVLQPHLASSRALFLVTGRSSDLRANPLAWDTLQSLDRTAPLPRYTLGRLSGHDIDALVHMLLGEDHPTVSDYLARESAGVPLYLVEILKTWRDEGYLVPTDHGTWKCREDTPTMLPAHLGQRVIDYRLSRLSSSAKGVLSAAAVIGTEVDFDLLARVCAPGEGSPDQPASDRHLLAATDELLRLGFLSETGVSYHFSHEQVRQAIYNGIPAARRQHLHRRVGQALQVLSPERFELLAHHFAAAGDRRLAIHHLTRAAERARALFAHQVALACYDHTLDLLDRPEDRPQRHNILHARAQVLSWVGDREAQGRDLEEMLRLAQTLSDELRLGRTLHQRSEWHRVQGHYEPAERDATAALEIYRRLQDDHAQAALLSQLGYNVVYTSNYPRAAQYFQEALSIYQDLGDLSGQIHCLIGLASVADLAGDYTRSFSYGRQVMALAQATGDPHHLARAHFNTAMNYYDLGDVQTAEGHLGQALRYSELTGDRRRQAATHFYLGTVPTETDDYRDARSHLEIALQIFREVQDLSWEGDTLAAMGRLAFLEDDPAAARDYLNAAYQRRCELGEPAYAVIDLSHLALAELALNSTKAAWQHSRQAVAELEAGLTGVEHPQRIYYNHYCVSQATGHWAAAREALDRAAGLVSERAARITDPLLRHRFMAGLRANREIAAAVAEQPPTGFLRVRLPRAEAPTHRRPAPEETVVLTWTVDAGQADADLAKRAGKPAWRRHCLLRLLNEAEAAGAAPSIADLAGALDVSTRTIRTDLAVLRSQGHTIHTRGCQS